MAQTTRNVPGDKGEKKLPDKYRTAEELRAIIRTWKRKLEGWNMARNESDAWFGPVLELIKEMEQEVG